MSGPARIAAFALVIVVVFAGAALAGTAVDPETSPSDAGSAGMAPASGGHGMEAGTSDEGQQDAAEGDHGGTAAGEQPAGEDGAEGASTTLPGLAVADGGYRLVVDRARFVRGESARFEFRILDGAGRPVTDFVTESDRRMHLIVVRRDLRRFQHLHPRQAGDGTWSVRLALPEAGTYRAFADFKVGEAKHTLGADLVVGGDFEPLELPAASNAAEVDGYQVSLTGGSSGELGFTVRRHGRVVDDLEDYLGAKGHLVTLREGDLAYLHTHPEDGALRFGVEYPSPGRYRLFVQFKHEGAVHTAAFTQEVTS